MKKITSIMMTLILLFALSVPAYAENNDIKVQLNGEYISFNVNPQQINGSTVVPINPVLDKLKFDTKYDSTTKTLTSSKDDLSIVLQVDNPILKVTKDNKTSEIKLPTSPKIINNTFFAPVRFISEITNAQVGWDEYENTVVIIDYDYFIDILKTKSPVLYDYLNTEYKLVNNSKEKLDFSLNIKANPPKSTDPMDSFTPLMSGPIDMGLDGNMNALIAEDTISLDILLNAKGTLKEFLNNPMLGLNGIDSIKLDVIVNSDSIYVKSDIFSKIPEMQGLPIKDKWIKFKLSDLDIPNAKSITELLQTKSQRPIDSFVESLKESNKEFVTVDTFNETKTAFEAVAYLLDDNHFKVNTVDKDTKTYTISISEQDILTLINKLAPEMTKEEKDEMLKTMNNLKLNYNADITIKNNSVVNEKFSLKGSFNSPEDGSFEIDFNGKLNTEVDKSTLKIDIPKTSDTIDSKELEKYNQ